MRDAEREKDRGRDGGREKERGRERQYETDIANLPARPKSYGIATMSTTQFHITISNNGSSNNNSSSNSNSSNNDNSSSNPNANVSISNINLLPDFFPLSTLSPPKRKKRKKKSTRGRSEKGEEMEAGREG